MDASLDSLINVAVSDETADGKATAPNSSACRLALSLRSAILAAAERSIAPTADGVDAKAYPPAAAAAKFIQLIVVHGWGTEEKCGWRKREASEEGDCWETAWLIIESEWCNTEDEDVGGCRRWSGGKGLMVGDGSKRLVSFCCLEALCSVNEETYCAINFIYYMMMIAIKFKKINWR